MRKSPAVIQFLAVSLLIVALVPASTLFAQAPAPAGWTTHNDAKGFAMDTPPSWNLASDARTGRIVVQGPLGEQVVVWPASIQQPLDARGAAALVQQMARQVDAQMPWGSAAAAGNAVRTIAKGHRQGSAA